MQPNIGRWLRNTTALRVCAGHLNPANSTCAWKKSSWCSRTMRNARTGRVPRSMQVIRSSSNSAGRVPACGAAHAYLAESGRRAKRDR